MFQGIPRTRRQVIRTAVAAAGGALAARALGSREVVEAANGATVLVGHMQSGTTATQITNASGSATAVAFKGVVSGTGAGGRTAGLVGQSDAQNGTGVF